ncbi:uncharacterized protein [Solanum tuberosum]|uniref:uncharacterized protein n=1 Tax=Solanum tuberosum TaxID=4113 RepID=UPI00073A2E31|nr:PREDICTED: uncharacterized protein LOC107062834 [Solanum tuberosum]
MAFTWVVHGSIAHFEEGKKEFAKIEVLSLLHSFGSRFRETDGQEERTIQTLEDMLRAFGLDFKAYELELPSELAAVHPVLHISMLKKCMGDPALIVPTESIGVKDTLSYEEIPVQILDLQVCKLRTKEVASAKVLWRNQFVEEATSKAEEDM